MSINLNGFWQSWGVVSGNTQANNQYEFWKGMVMSNGQVLASQYDFFQYHNTTRYQWFKALQGTYPEVWDEYTFYKNTNDARIYDHYTFYKYCGEYLVGTPVTPTPTPTNTPTPTPTPTPTNTPTPTPSPAAWSPANLTGAYIWLDASDGITTSGGLVTSWTDKITSLVFNSTTTGQFTYNATDSSFNNKPTLYWDKTPNIQACKLTNTNIVYGGEDLFYWGVYLIPNASLRESMLFSIAGGGGISYQTMFIVNATGRAEYLVLGGGTRNESPYNMNYDVPRLFIGRRKNGSPFTNDLWDNRTTPVSVTQSGTFTPATLTGTVGNEATGGAFQYQWTGKIAEIGWAKGSVSDGEVSQLITYLVNKYGITLN